MLPRRLKNYWAWINCSGKPTVYRTLFKWNASTALYCPFSYVTEQIDYYLFPSDLKDAYNCKVQTFTALDTVELVLSNTPGLWRFRSNRIPEWNPRRTNKRRPFGSRMLLEKLANYHNWLSQDKSATTTHLDRDIEKKVAGNCVFFWS